MVREADQAPRKIMDLCCQHLVEPDISILQEISVLLGIMSHTLRSSLNNMIWDFAGKGLTSVLSNDEFERIKWSHDFPIENDKLSFENSRVRILRHLKEYFPPIYDYIESCQPYHNEFSILWTIKLLSNDTTHTTPVEVIQPNITSVALSNGGAPRVIGDKVVVPFDRRNPTIYQLPCFIEVFDMFVSNEGKWIIYMIGIDQDPKYSVTGFISNASVVVGNVIAGFYSIVEALL